jgi:MFS family permease
VFPVLFARQGVSVAQVGVLAALFPAVWGGGQFGTGALSDRIGRKWLNAGMGAGFAIGLIAHGTTLTTRAVAALTAASGVVAIGVYETQASPPRS